MKIPRSRKKRSHAASSSRLPLAEKEAESSPNLNPQLYSTLSVLFFLPTTWAGDSSETLESRARLLAERWTPFPIVIIESNARRGVLIY